LADEWRIQSSRFAVIGGVVALFAGSALTPTFDASTRQQVSLQVIDGPSEVSLSVDNRGGPLNAARGETLGLPLIDGRRLPWSPITLPGTALKDVSRTERRPMVAVIKNENGRVQIGVMSKRDASRIGLAIPANIDAEDIQVNGQHFPQSVRGGHRSPYAWRTILVQVAPNERVRFDIHWPANTPCRGYVYDMAFQLPEEATTLQSKRDKFGIPVHSGDTHLVWNSWTADQKTPTTNPAINP
jgi:hypothetical protein